jgi:glucose/arabinose dehydrogenase
MRAVMTTHDRQLTTRNGQLKESNLRGQKRVCGSMNTRHLLPLLLAPLAAFTSGPAPAPAPDANLSKIKLPAGFTISYFAQGVKSARELAVGPDGTVYVGTKDDKVYALPDRNKDGRADEVVTVATGLNAPNGVAVRNGALYVAEINRILRYDNIAQRLKQKPQP